MSASATLESRITRLERQNKTLRATLVICALGLVTCAGGNTANFGRVNTNSLVIETGDEQAVISMSAKGSITFHDPAGSVTLDAKTVAKLLAAAP